MNYDEISANADKIMAEIDTAVAEGRTQHSTKQEMLKIRIAAGKAMLLKMQEELEQENAEAEKSRQMANV